MLAILGERDVDEAGSRGGKRVVDAGPFAAVTAPPGSAQPSGLPLLLALLLQLLLLFLLQRRALQRVQQGAGRSLHVLTKRLAKHLALLHAPIVRHPHALSQGPLCGQNLPGVKLHRLRAGSNYAP